MKPFAAFLVGLVAVCAARADIAIPPPAGKKFVPVDYTLTTDKAYPEHEFYLVTGYMGEAKLVKFGPDAPVKVAAAGRRGPYGHVTFAAVPKGAGEKFAGLKEFGAALRKGTVPGQATAKHDFVPSATIAATDPRTAVTETLAVEKVDAKAGIVFKAAKAAPTSPAPGGAPKSADDPADDAAAAPRGGRVIAGLAVALALGFAGLWVVRRSRA